MFVQVIEGRVTDEAGIRKQQDRWEEELMPGAEGFIGSTSGVSEEGIIIIGSRWESEEAARKNSDRPEQTAWWEETSGYVEDVKFYDCTDVDVWGPNKGGSDEAGFVQVIQGYAKDPARLREIGQMMDRDMPDHRPDVLGGMTAWGPDNGFSDFIYFTSEAEAREGEKKETPPEMQEIMKENMELVSDMRYIDLKEPRLVSK